MRGYTLEDVWHFRSFVTLAGPGAAESLDSVVWLASLALL